TLYGHMTYGSRVVQAGQTVAAGQVIGLVGSTGRSTANHLHFEVMLNGTHVDPLAWLLTNVGPVP
ncbi:MAG: M23 family metallopeptidase, partial [Microbacterium sp.]|nr:M23 family metallopeptidase [Microbacterium sp.]